MDNIKNKPEKSHCRQLFNLSNLYKTYDHSICCELIHERREYYYKCVKKYKDNYINYHVCVSLFKHG